MTSPFAPCCRTLAILALFVSVPFAAFAQTPAPNDNGEQPAGGHYKQCHGYIRHVSDVNIKVHCIDGDPSDQSFLYFPKYAHLSDGKSLQTKDLTPDTPVRVIYTQSLGVKKATKIYVADPNGNGNAGSRL